MTNITGLGWDRRRGVAVLVVLLMISVTMAVAYVSLRSQSIASVVQRNAGLRGSARQAAMTGLAAALKEMQSASWAGVDTTLAQPLGSGQRFEATFTTGDASLLPGDPDYGEYPFRVTLLVTGFAADPSAGGSHATHAIRAVVRLVPRRLADEPSGWSDITDHTFCQWASGDASLTVPFRIEGPVRIRARLDLSEDQLRWSDDPRWWYMTGLNWARLSGQPDWRPFDGPIHLDYSEQDSDTLSLVRTALGLSTRDTRGNSSFRWSTPLSSRTYRLYPGGKAYSATTLAGNLRDVTLEPDPRVNPAGIFLCNGELRLQANVTIRGTVITAGSSNADIDVSGANVRILAFDLPALMHPDVPDDRPVQLPTLVAADDILLRAGSQCLIEGLVIAADDFRVDEARQAETSLSVRGKVAAKDLYIDRRDEWNQTKLWWNDRLSQFLLQYLWPGGIRAFPTWLGKYHGLNPEPRITIRSDDREILYHWQNASDPIYAAHPDDGGLRWELLDWTDNPPT